MAIGTDQSKWSHTLLVTNQKPESLYKNTGSFEFPHILFHLFFVSGLIQIGYSSETLLKLNMAFNSKLTLSVLGFQVVDVFLNLGIFYSPFHNLVLVLSS